MAKVLEYKTLLSGWKTIREIPIEATDGDWLDWASRRFSEIRVRMVKKEVA